MAIPVEGTRGFCLVLSSLSPLLPLTRHDQNTCLTTVFKNIFNTDANSGIKLLIVSEDYESH